MIDAIIVCVRKKLAYMIDNAIACVRKEISRYGAHRVYDGHHNRVSECRRGYRGRECTRAWRRACVQASECVAIREAYRVS